MESSSPLKSNTCAVIVTYNPDPAVGSRIAATLEHVAEAIVVDNGSGNRAQIVDEMVRQDARFTKIENNENLGVAAALNQGIALAIEHDFKWALTMDQDSCALPALMEAAQKAYQRFPEPHRIAVIGADHDHPFYYKKRRRYPNAGDYREMRTVITSGSLVNLRVLKQIGGFKEELFIDSVDDEYCMRARQRGFKVIETTVFGISHKIGAPKIVRLLGKPRSTSNHSPVRRYYMTRNRLVLAVKYLLKDPAWAFLLVKSLLREVLFFLLFEEEKSRKLKATILGTCDALTHRMGKLEESRLSSATNAS